MDTTLCADINWVGHIDWNIRDFHSYNTTRGATYNAYLVRDEKTALIDTVKASYFDQLMKNVEALTTPEAIDYVICNHAEPDHSGSLPRVMQTLPNATLVCTPKCQGILEGHYDTSTWTIQTVRTGDSIPLGKRSLHFIETPMVHWPDSMFTYVPEEKLLFSMDAFGQHYASSQRFDDGAPLCTIMEEAKTYYANIVMPYGKQVEKVLAAAQDLEIEMIAPSHGFIWRKHIAKIVAAYRNWCVCRPKAKVVVVYDTMWESTEKMARAIAEGASEDDIDVKLIAIRQSDLTHIATEFLDAATIAFGSSTLNMNMMPAAGSVLTYLKGLRPAGKSGLAFGSFGWGKGGPEAVDACLQEMNWEMLRPPLKAKFRPGEENLTECREAGRLLAEKAREKAKRPSGTNLCVDP